MSKSKALALPNPTLSARRVFDTLDVAETTRDDYKARIGLFLEYTERNGFNRNTFLDYKRYLTNRTDYAVATKNKYLATAKIFLKEMNKQGVIPADVTQNIKTFSQDKKHKREGLNEAEITRLADKLHGLDKSPANTRLKAILSLLALQGLRQIEVTRLDVKDLDLVGRKAYVQGKGRDDKEPIALHPDTVTALKEYLSSNRVADGALFVSYSNNSRRQRLTTRGVRATVSDTLKSLGIDKTTHGFRHYFTTTLIKTYKGDLLEVARYTRHKSLEMLQVYNDNIKRQADLPRYYEAFAGVKF